MKLLKNLIFSFVLLLVFSIQGYGKHISVNLGIYDFTNEAARDFYALSPMMIFEYNVLEFNRVTINLGSGLAYRQISYNSNRHDVFLFPGTLTMLYKLPNLGSNFTPYFGGGIGILIKYDNNQWLDEPHIVTSWGYNLQFGFSYAISKRLAIGGNLKYNLVYPPNMESINTSGIFSSIEIRYNLGKLLVTP